MNGFGARKFGSADQLSRPQVAVARTFIANAVSFVGEFEVSTAAVAFAEHSDRFDAHFFASANNTQRDLAAVGNQDSIKHWFAG